MFPRTLTAVAATTVVILLAGCSAGSAPEPSENSGHAPLLKLGMVDAPGPAGFVAADMNLATTSAYGQAVYDSLLRATPTNEIEAHLASDWEWNADSTVLTLTLRDDVVFTDDTKFTADVARQNLLRFRDGNSSDAGQLAYIADVVAVNETTLQITLSSPDPSLLLALTKAGGFQESPASFDDPTPVGTGPYLLDEDKTVADSSYAFVANEDYWAPELQHYDAIEMTVIKDATAMQNALLGNQLNATLYSWPDSLSTIEADGNFTVTEYMQDWQGLLLFDRTGAVNPAMADVRVRQAINYAIDRDAMLAALMPDVSSESTSQVWGSETPGFDEALNEEYPYDPDRAEALLKDAGFADGFELTLPTTSFVSAATFDLIVQQLDEVGITVMLDERAPSDFIGGLLGGQYAASAFTLNQPSTAWDTYRLVAAPDAPWNVTHQTPDEVLALGKALQTGTENEALAAAGELNAYLVENAWFNPWFLVVTTFVTDADTQVTAQVGNTLPYLWNITPAGK